MAEPNSVKILKVCKIEPLPCSPNSPSPPKSLPLIFFDLFILRFPPIDRLFFYEISNTNTSFFFDSILPKLQLSLSLTLSHFLPLAGNLTWPPESDKPIIQYVAGDGVSLTIAESNADFHHLSSYELREAIKLYPLISPLQKSHTKVPVISLQITVFKNFGFCIGISAHHAFLDGKSTTMFLKSWAHICKFGEDSKPIPPELTPFFDRTLIKDPAGLEKIFLNGWLNENGSTDNKSLMFWDLKSPPDGIRGTFVLSATDLTKLKASVSAKLMKNTKNPENFRVSTFALTCAYAWICLVKAEGLKDSKVSIAIPPDCRLRINPPIPSNYFGNCIGVRQIDLEANELVGEDGFAIAVQAISEDIRSLDDDQGLKGAEGWISKVFSVQSGRLVAISGSPRFELYKTDFGWGRPRKVEMTSIDKIGSICFTDSGNGDGGVEIGLSLKKHEMEAFASLFAKGIDGL